MNIYLGMFVIAFATLALEVTLARLLSVITWYHLAFFAISTAMLGMTAGAVTVYIRPSWFTKEKLADSVSKACLGYSLIIPFAVVLLCLTPLTLQLSVMSLFALLIATAACSLPFYFSGIAITGVLTRHPLPIGKLYASDLVGAALGCLFVLGGLEYLDAASLILLCAAVGGLAGLSFSWHTPNPKLRLRHIAVLVVLLVVAIANSMTSYGIRPFVVRGRIENSGDYLLEKWNSFSRVAVYPGYLGEASYWGPSPLAPKKSVYRHMMNIDGDAATVLGRFSSLDDISYLRFDVTNVAYYLRPRGGACIIGVGGGRDIQSAVLFGHERVTGVEVNPILCQPPQDGLQRFCWNSEPGLRKPC